MSRSVVVVVCASLSGAGAACGADQPFATPVDTSGAPAESSSGPIVESTSSSSGPIDVDESTSGTAPGTTGTSSSDEGEATHQPIFDVFEQGDLPPDDSTTGGIIIDWDCDDLVQPFESEAELVGPRGYHDVYFNEDGQIIGYDGSSLVASTYDGEVSVFLPGVTNGAQGMDVLANWDLLYVNDYSELRMVTPGMVATTITGSVSGPYGITVGPDQLAYVSTNSGILRVDPETGEVETWLATNEHPRAMVFNLDSSGVYFSTLGGGNNSVFYQAVDNNLNVDEDEPLVQFADNVGQGYHDGLGIDACGNLYVPDYNTRGLYRVDPEAVVTMLFSEDNASPSHYGHGLEWGSGIDGWNDKAIYLPQPYDGYTVLEVVLGVPSGSLVRTWD